LAPSPGKKRWKSTIFERWTIEFNRMNSMMMLNYQSVQKGWKTTSDWSRSMIHCLIGWGGTPAGAFCLKTNWYQLCQLIIKRSFEYPPAVCSIHSETNRDNLNCSNICSRFPPMRNAEQNLGTDMISWYKNKKKHILSYIWNMISHPSARGHPPAPPLPWRLTGAACAGAGWHWLQLGHPGVSRWRGAKPCRWGLKVTPDMNLGAKMSKGREEGGIFMLFVHGDIANQQLRDFVDIWLSNFQRQPYLGEMEIPVINLRTLNTSRWWSEI
jgi:hypothetical protein